MDENIDMVVFAKNVCGIKDYIKCPFCGGNDFDKVGLKDHLQHGDCEEYNNIDTSNIKRMF